MDLDDKLIIKVQLNDEIRKMPIHNEDITYDELIIMMERVFKHKLSPNDEIIIRYKDEDNDLITISDDPDLAFAIESSKVLKLVLTVKTEEEDVEKGEKQLCSLDLKAIRRELQKIRDQINKLLDKVVHINSDPSWNANASGRASATSHGDYHTVGGKEFDPLSVGNQSNVQAVERTESLAFNIRRDDNYKQSMPTPITSDIPTSQVSQSMYAPNMVQSGAPPSTTGAFNLPPSTIGGHSTPPRFIGGQSVSPQNVRGHSMPPQMMAGQHMPPSNLGAMNLPPSSMGGPALPPNFGAHVENAAKMPGYTGPPMQGYMNQPRPAFYPAGQTRPVGAPPILNPAMPNGQTRLSYFNPPTTMQPGSQMQSQQGYPHNK